MLSPGHSLFSSLNDTGSAVGDCRTGDVAYSQYPLEQTMLFPQVCFANMSEIQNVKKLNRRSLAVKRYWLVLQYAFRPALS